MLTLRCGFAQQIALRIERKICREVAQVQGFRDIVWAVAVSPNGKFAAAAGGGDTKKDVWVPGSDYAVRIFQPKTGAIIRSLTGPTGAVSSLQFFADSSKEAAAAGEAVHIWDVSTGTELLVLKPGKQGANHLAIAPNGKQLVTGGWDRTIRIWDLATGKEVCRLLHPAGRVWDVAWSPDGKSIAVCGDLNTIRLIDPETGKDQRILEGHISAAVRLAYSPDGTKLLSGGWDHNAMIWDPATGKLLHRLPHPQRIEGVAWAPDGKLVVTGCLDQVVRVWDASAGSLVKNYVGHEKAIARVAVTTDGEYALSAGWDKVVRIWRMPPR